jgi:Cu(I)/Ag(I) efflux system membrane protein CusA/SilA
MIPKLIEWSLRNRFLVACGTLLLIALGIFEVRRAPVDAIPDLSENQVIVFADWEGRAPREVEDQVTYPLSTQLQGLAGVKAVRAQSMFGFSLLTVIFRDDVDNYFARSRVLERLNSIGDSLPAGVAPKLGPDASGLGWVYQYYLDVDPAKAPQGGYDLGRLRAEQDYFVRYSLQSVPGVAEVASVGGFVRQWQVEVSSFKMKAAGVSLDEVITAVGQSSLNVGGRVIEENGMEFVVRGLGLVKSATDLEHVVLREREGTPIFLRDVARIEVGGDFRRGALDVNGHEVVGGVVVMRTGENAHAVIKAVKEEIARIAPSLPAGVSIKPFYDRSELIDLTIGTLKHALIEEVILVTLAHVIFLFHFRSILIVTFPLPVSILIAFVLMRQFGITSNVMSLAGIAIAIGVLVDAAIVITENVIRHCEKAEEEKVARLKVAQEKSSVPEESRGGELPGGARDSRAVCGDPPQTPLDAQPQKEDASGDGPMGESTSPDVLSAGRRQLHASRVLHPEAARLTAAETWQVTLKAAQQVGRPIFFAMAIIILAFVPVFALTGQEGKLFHPLAFTKTFAMIGSTLLAVTIVPVLCALLVRGPFHREEDNWVMRALLRIYDPVLDWALRRRKTVLALAALLLVSALTLALGLPRAALAKLDAFPRVQNTFAGIGGEFMPPLNEGNLLFMPVFIPTTSLTEVKRVLAWQDRVIASTPEVLSVGGKLGRADTATDPAPVEMVETTIMLKPQDQWRKGMTLQKLQNELTEKLAQVPGYVPGAFLQPIENRRLMLATGIRAQLGVKILGDDLDTLQRLTFEVERAIREVPGAAGVSPLRVQGKPYLEIEIDREAAGRFGIRAEQLFAVIEAGLGGRKVATTIEGRVRVPIQVRLAREERDDIERIGSLLIGMPGGKHIPLAQVATIRRTSGPNEIQSENGRLKSYVQANVQGRDLAGFVKEVKARVEAIPRPPGVKFEFAGEYENHLRLIDTMKLVVPIVLTIIFMLLYIVYGSVKEAAHVILAVPFALTGGVFLQYALGYNFSAAVAVGYIALFGTAIQTGVVMVVYLEEALAQKRKALGAAFTRTDLIAAIKEGARLRLRPKVMTVATIVASLLPIMWSTRTGAEVMKPLAAPVIGGMLSSLLHILVVTPVIFAWLREREYRSEVHRSP